MAMTIGRLHKLLGKMIEQGHARKKVCINKDSFFHPLEGDGAVILEAETAQIEAHPMIDDDGFTKFRADGSESMHTSLIIGGGYE
jgi:hypothetical protein